MSGVPAAVCSWSRIRDAPITKCAITTKHALIAVFAMLQNHAKILLQFHCSQTGAGLNASTRYAVTNTPYMDRPTRIPEKLTTYDVISLFLASSKLFTWIEETETRHGTFVPRTLHLSTYFWCHNGLKSTKLELKYMYSITPRLSTKSLRLKEVNNFPRAEECGDRFENVLQPFEFWNLDILDKCWQNFSCYNWLLLLRLVFATSES